MSTDPNWSSVSLLLHCDGADGGTTFTDNSPLAHTITRLTAVTATADKKWGTAALSAAWGTTKWVKAPVHASLVLGSSDFTIECWAKPDGTNAGASVMASNDDNSHFTPWQFNVPSGAASVRFSASSNNSSFDVASNVAIGTFTGSWDHIAVTRSGSTWSTYINGVRTSTFTSSATLHDVNTQPTYVGGATGGAGILIDDFRITKGLARYTGASYTVPTEAFADTDVAPAQAAPAFQPMTAAAYAAYGAPAFRTMSAVGGAPASGIVAFLPMTALAGGPVSGIVSMQPMTAAAYAAYGKGAFATMAATAAGQQLTYGAPAFMPMAATAEGVGGPALVLVGAAPAPGLLGLILPGVSIAALLRAPVPLLVARNFSPALITSALRAPAPRARITLLAGSISRAALLAPAPLLVASGYPAYLITAALRAPAPRVDAQIDAAVLAAFRAWVLNTRKGALSEYGPEFAFNSLARFNNQVLACGSGGVVVLGVQDLDNAALINGQLRTGQDSFESSFHKRVPRIYVSGNFPGEMRFRTLTVEGGTRGYALLPNGIANIQQRRVPVGKGPRSRFWQFEVENVDGADFGINDILVYPTLLRRRVQ